MAWLLGIRNAASIQTLATRGALFGTEQGMQAVEIKYGSTFASDWPDAIHHWRKIATDAARTPVIVCGGKEAYGRQGCRVIGWRELPALAV